MDLLPLYFKIVVSMLHVMQNIIIYVLTLITGNDVFRMRTETLLARAVTRKSLTMPQ